MTSIQKACKTKEKVLLEATILFARQGYGGVSMKDIAGKVGIKSASLYNHFSSKEDLWNAVMEHVRGLYLMYFSRLEDAKQPGQSFRKVLESMFVELKTVVAIFSYYGFGLVQTEQFRDEKAGRIFLDIFLDHSITYIAGRFEECVEQGLVKDFDTRGVATLFMHSVMVGNNVRVHEDLGRDVPYDVTEMFETLERLILKLVGEDQ